MAGVRGKEAEKLGNEKKDRNPSEKISAKPTTGE